MRHGLVSFAKKDDCRGILSLRSIFRVEKDTTRPYGTVPSGSEEIAACSLEPRRIQSSASCTFWLFCLMQTAHWRPARTYAHNVCFLLGFEKIGKKPRKEVRGGKRGAALRPKAGKEKDLRH